MERVVIVGAGAMGCLFAARLARCGVGVNLVEIDTRRIALINARGITIGEDGHDWTARVPATTAADCPSRPDLVILFVKAMHSAAALASVARLARSHCHALTLQNGLGNAELLAAIFGAERTLLGVTDQPADLVDDTRVSVHGEGRVWLGGLAGGSSEACEQVRALFGHAGIDAEVVADPERAVWEKAAFNAALNASAAITGATVGALDRAEGRRIASMVLDEVEQVAKACGIGFSRKSVEVKIEFALANHRGHMASMLQDRLAGRPTEIDAINGAIADRAVEAGLAAPVNLALADLVRMITRIET